MKECRLCRERKDESEFYLLKGRPIARCKACTCAIQKNWREKHQTKEQEARWAETVKAKQLRMKHATFAAYGGYVCACCGETERLFLTIDHVFNDGAAWRRDNFRNSKAAGRRTYHWLVKHNFPAGFQVLCMNCNFGKRMNHGTCPHISKTNDYPLVGVGSSDPKRIAPKAFVANGDEIVCSAAKVAAAN